jgi:predicted acyl esterase
MPCRRKCSADGNRKLQLQAYQRARESSHSFSDYDAWVDECQPDLTKVDVPLLIINSMDDPVVVHENSEAFRHLVLENEHLVQPCPP